jgi:hypothetical protein
MTPKELKREILNRLSPDANTIDVICEIIEATDEYDYHDVADLIKEDATMLAVITHEFQNRNMLPKESCSLSLIDLFKDF